MEAREVVLLVLAVQSFRVLCSNPLRVGYGNANAAGADIEAKDAVGRRFRHWEIILRDLRPRTSDLRLWTSGQTTRPEALLTNSFPTNDGWCCVTSALEAQAMLRVLREVWSDCMAGSCRDLRVGQCSMKPALSV